MCESVDGFKAHSRGAHNRVRGAENGGAGLWLCERVGGLQVQDGLFNVIELLKTASTNIPNI